MWVGALTVLAIAITIIAFFNLVAPENRSMSFHFGVVMSCLAELVMFAYLAYTLSGGIESTDASHAVRLRTTVLVIFWMAGIILTSALAAMPSLAGNLFTDKMIIWQLIISFLVLLGAYFFHRQESMIEEKRAEPERERAQVKSYSLGVDRLLDTVRGLSGRYPQQAVELDQFARRLDTLKNQLRGALPVSQRDRAVAPETIEQVEQALRAVHEQVQRVASAIPEDFAGELTRARQTVDDALATLRQRGNTLNM
jgi:hypothetical protein